MADQPPPPYPGTDSEKTLLPGEAEIPSAPPPDAHSAYPPPSSDAPVQPPYPQSAQPAPYPSQPYPPPTAADGPPAAGTGYPASAPPVSVPPAGQVSNVGGAVTYSIPPPTPYGYPGVGVGREQFQNTLKVGAGMVVCVLIAICVIFCIFFLGIAIAVPLVATR